MQINIAWQEVDTVLLDMDGTLLDLAFDNYFWQNWSRKPGAPRADSTCRKPKRQCIRSITPCSIR